MSSFAVNDSLDVTRPAGYQRFALYLGDFSDTNFLDCLLHGLSAWRLLVCHFILHNSRQVLDRILPDILAQKRFSSKTQWLLLICKKECHPAWRSCSHGHAYGLPFFEQYIVVSEGIKYRPAAPWHRSLVAVSVLLHISCQNAYPMTA